MNVTSSIDDRVDRLLGRIDSIFLPAEAGQKKWVRFREMSPEDQERVRRLLSKLLNSKFSEILNNLGEQFNLELPWDNDRRIVIDGKEIVLDEECASVWQQVRGASEKIGVSSDGLSATRNTLLAAAPAAKGVSAIVAGTRLASGTLGIVGGAILAESGVKEIRESEEIESTVRGGLKVISGVSNSGSGVGMLLYTIFDLLGKSTAANLANAILMSPLTAAVGAGLFLLGIGEAALAISFRWDLNDALEKSGTQGGIAFLYENLFLTKEDELQLNEIQDLEKRKEESEKLLQRKRNHFKRRVDGMDLAPILSQIEKYKKLFEATSVEPETVKMAMELVDSVSRSNFKQVVKSLFLATVATATFFVGLGTGPAGTAAFSAVLASAWLLSDCTFFSEMSAELCWALNRKVFEKSGDAWVEPQIRLHAIQGIVGVVFQARAKSEKRRQKPDTDKQFKEMLRQICHAKVRQEDVASPEGRLKVLQEQMPDFYQCLKEGVLLEDDGIEAKLSEAKKHCLEEFSGLRLMPEGMLFLCAAVHLLGDQFTDET